MKTMHNYVIFLTVRKDIYKQDEAGDFVKVSETTNVVPNFWIRLTTAIKLLLGDIQNEIEVKEWN